MYNKFRQRNLIVIDPGHGGDQTGAVNMMDASDPDDDIKEKDLALHMAWLLIPLFRQAGFDVALTRAKDDTVSLRDRVVAANKLNAALFLSVHFNASPAGYENQFRGFEAFYAHVSTEGKRWAESVVDGFGAAFPTSKNRGAKPDNESQHSSLYVLQHTRMPAILVEPSFLSNPTGLMWTYRRFLDIAQVIVNGTMAYWQTR